MKPLKYKELLPEISQRAEQPQAVVETVLKVFWSEVRHQLSTLKHPRIQILNLGTFSVKTGPLKERLTRRRNLLQKIQGEETRKKVALRNDATYEVGLMENILTAQQLEAERKRDFKKRQSDENF